MKVREKLNYDVESFPISDDHYVFGLQSEEDRDTVLEAKPWIIDGQILAMEAWIPKFIMGMDSMTKTVAWLLLPNPFLEY